MVQIKILSKSLSTQHIFPDSPPGFTQTPASYHLSNLQTCQRPSWSIWWRPRPDLNSWRESCPDQHSSNQSRCSCSQVWYNTFFLVPTSEETSFLTTFYGLYFSHHTHITHYKSFWTFCVGSYILRYNSMYVTEGRLRCRGSYIALSYDAYSHC